jgi:hypothetical protein
MKKFLLAVLSGIFLFALAACTASTPAVQSGFMEGTSPSAPMETTVAAEITSPTVEPTAVATAEPTAALPEVTLTVITDQYCRVSPDINTTGTGHFVAGETMPALGQNYTHDFFYIANPDLPGEYCWIWDNYVFTDGDHYSLPVVDSSN